MRKCRGFAAAAEGFAVEVEGFATVGTGAA